MSYVKTTWVAGDTITAAKLNKIEDELERLSNLTVYNGEVEDEEDPEPDPTNISDPIIIDDLVGEGK